MMHMRIFSHITKFWSTCPRKMMMMSFGSSRTSMGHKGPFKKEYRDYKGSPYNVTVLWENGETSDKPLSVIAADDPVSCTMYAHDNNLLDLPHSRRFRTMAKKQKNLFRLANLAKIQKF